MKDELIAINIPSMRGSILIRPLELRTYPRLMASSRVKGEVNGIKLMISIVAHCAAKPTLTREQIARMPHEVVYQLARDILRVSREVAGLAPDPTLESSLG